MKSDNNTFYYFWLNPILALIRSVFFQDRGAVCKKDTGEIEAKIKAYPPFRNPYHTSLQQNQYPYLRDQIS